MRQCRSKREREVPSYLEQEDFTEAAALEMQGKVGRSLSLTAPFRRVFGEEFCKSFDSFHEKSKFLQDDEGSLQGKLGAALAPRATEVLEPVLKCLGGEASASLALSLFREGEVSQEDVSRVVEQITPVDNDVMREAITFAHEIQEHLLASEVQLVAAVCGAKRAMASLAPHVRRPGHPKSRL